MNRYRKGFVGLTLNCLFYLMATSGALPAFAQGTDDNPQADGSAKEAPTAEATPAPEDQTEQETEGEAASDSVKPTTSGIIQSKAGVTAETPAGGTADSSDAAQSDVDEKDVKGEAKAFFNAMGVRWLPAEAYPVYKTRGIKGGSLWRTFHGLQWPYMPETGIGLSGSVWVDTGYEKINRKEDPNQPNTKYLLQDARFLFRVTPTFSRGRWFIQGQSEFVANKDQSLAYPLVVNIDDLWVRVGMWNLWDLQAGRYEAWELYHFGMGMDINTLERRGATDASGLTVPDIYGVTSTYYRPAGAGNVAVHLYPTKFLRFEILGQLGNQAGLNTGAFRGAGILDFGFMKLKGGGEYKKQYSTTGGYEQRDERGFGGTAQFVIDPYVELGGSGGYGITDHLDSRNNIDEEGSTNTWSAGGFLNVRIIKDLVLGGGGNYTRKWDIHKDEYGIVGDYYHLQTFGAIQYLLFDQLYIKAVFAWAKGHFDPSFTEDPPYANYMLSGRLRLEYDF